MKFGLNEVVTTDRGETGTVISRAEHISRQPAYEVRFDGGATRWMNEDELAVPSVTTTTASAPAE